jgi:predicted nucleic acid-binding protein
LVDLPVERYPHGPLVERIWSLRDNFTAYDATYLALAETIVEHGAALLTSDARFANAARAHSDVEVLLED